MRARPYFKFSSFRKMNLIFLRHPLETALNLRTILCFFLHLTILPEFSSGKQLEELHTFEQYSNKDRRKRITPNLTIYVPIYNFWAFNSEQWDLIGYTQTRVKLMGLALESMMKNLETLFFPMHAALVSPQLRLSKRKGKKKMSNGPHCASDSFHNTIPKFYNMLSI